ncbi:MAG: hypothetical protein IJG70_03170 [Kiritimatiellae bacterium]|nr:hypothetical protein [Kiritimatiellia bacterium]
MMSTIWINDMPECLVYILRVVVAPLATLALSAWLARIAVRRRYVMLLLGLALLLIGCAAWSNPKHIGFFEPMCNALPSFFLSRGDYDWPLSAETFVVTRILYDLFHVAVIIYMLSILLAFFGIELVNRLFVGCRVLFRRPVNVFWGYSDEAQSIAASMEGTERGGVVFALHETGGSWMKMQESESVHVLSRNGWKWERDDPERCRMLLSAERHFFLGPDGQMNIAGAEAVVRRLRGKGVQVKLYVRVGAESENDVVCKWADRWNCGEDSRAEVIIVREDALVSRRFLLRHPMLECPRISIDTNNATVTGDFKVLLLGFGSQGRTLLSDMICDSQYLSPDKTRTPFEVHVFDRDPSSFGAYAEMCREAVFRYNVKFNGVEIGTADFWQQFQAEMAICPYNRVVVCLHDDNENISVATTIARIYKEMRLLSRGVVFARIRNSQVANCVDAMFGYDECQRTFMPFGSMSETYSFENIVTRKWERGALWLNGDYNKKPGDPHDADMDAELWRKTSTFSKESSRASFFHQRNLLRLIGYCVDDTSNVNECFKDEDPMNHLDVLAEDEHLRWMAFHLVRGIKAWRPSDEEIENRIANTGKRAVHNAIDELNAHADLVEYSELPGVDSQFDSINARHGFVKIKGSQEKDKGLIRSEAMRQSGLGIEKI